MLVLIDSLLTVKMMTSVVLTLLAMALHQGLQGTIINITKGVEYVIITKFKSSGIIE